MRTYPQLLRPCVLLAALLLSSIQAIAAAPKDITEEEMGLLPKYCPYTQTFNKGVRLGMANDPVGERWLETVGAGFWSLHHYCWAQIQHQRAARSDTSAQEARSLREEALANLTFVIKNSPPDMVLLPEIYTWIGRTEMMLRHPDRAKGAFAVAWKLKPDYWPAYFHWGEALRSMGHPKDALAVVQEGLKQAPDAAALQELRKTLR